MSKLIEKRIIKCIDKSLEQLYEYQGYGRAMYIPLINNLESAKQEFDNLRQEIDKLKQENKDLRKKVKPESPSSPTNLKMDLRDI